jgi:hypothetical protein
MFVRPFSDSNCSFKSPMLLDTINSLSMGFETFTCQLAVNMVNCKLNTMDSYIKYWLLSAAVFFHVCEYFLSHF